MHMQTLSALILLLVVPAVANASEVYIRVNQLGFGTADFKSAMVFGQQSLPDEFKIINADTGSVVLRGRINPSTGSWGQFDRHGEIDFSSLKSEGTYIIEAGAARSPKFQISRTANAEVPDQLLDFMRQQAKEGVQQGNSYGAPYRYAETTWADDMEWGAAELFRATKDARYLRDSKRYALKAGTESWMGKHEAGHYQFYPFINAGHFRLYDLVDARARRNSSLRSIASRSSGA